MRSPKLLHNLQHDEGGNHMAETETDPGIVNIDINIVLQIYVLCEPIPKFETKCNLLFEYH